MHSHLAGDGSLNKKRFKEFCQFRLNLLIKMSCIPDFKNFWSRVSKVIAKKRFFLFITEQFFVFEKNFILAIPPKLAKIIGVCLVHTLLFQELGDRAVEAQACYSLGNTYTLLKVRLHYKPATHWGILTHYLR